MSFWKCCFMQDIKIWWTLHSMDIIIIYYIAHQSVKRQWACFYFIRAALFKLVTSQLCMKTRSLYFVFKMHSFNRVRVFAQFGRVFCLPIVVRIGRVSWWLVWRGNDKPPLWTMSFNISRGPWVFLMKCWTLGLGEKFYEKYCDTPKIWCISTFIHQFLQTHATRDLLTKFAYG